MVYGHRTQPGHSAVGLRHLIVSLLWLGTTLLTIDFDHVPAWVFGQRLMFFIASLAALS